jgi:UDP-glucuronate 4-epimerase
MKIFITGATGFVGKSLLKKIEAEKIEVFPVVRKSYGMKNEIILNLDNVSEEKMYLMFKNADCIIHLAAFANFQKEFDYDTYNVNCIATIKLVNVISKLNKHFIFASNALISGIDVEEINSQTLDNPNIPYNISKYIAEMYANEKIAKLSILRIGGIYGLNGPTHLFLNRAINEIILNKTIPKITDDGKGIRNYIYVDDLCNVILNMVEYKLYGKFLVAGCEESSLKEILDNLVNVFIGKNNSCSVNRNKKGKNQIIIPSPTTINMRSYKEAFLDILYKIRS